MNLFADIWEKALEDHTPPPEPLLPALVKDDAASYVLQEKLLSLSGEDFRVKDSAGRTVMEVAGANLNLGGVVIDKLGLRDASGNQFCSVERRILAMTTCYDIYRDGELIGVIERELFGFTPVYKFEYRGGANGGEHNLKAEGSFSERKYTFKNGRGRTVARVGRNWMELFDEVDQYQVEIAAGVDAAAVLAVAVVIDEEHDEGKD